MDLSSVQLGAAMVATAAACVLSASAGLGGSLILVPALAAILGPKTGVALAALLLAFNNVAKTSVYWRWIPWRAALLVALATMIGAAIGAQALVLAPERWVSVGIIGVIAATFVFERLLPVDGRLVEQHAVSGALAFGAGATSGFSGTSGPLKGVALRSMRLERMGLVGAASAVSLLADVTKTVVYAQSGLIGRDALLFVLAMSPVMVLAALTGRRLNRQIGERGYAVLFWAVMTGYSARLAFS